MDKAFFPYGKKSKDFLLKRTLYLCKYLENKVDKIILACNTLSLIALPFLRLFYDNITGVFNYFIPYITKDTAILGSSKTIEILSQIYPNNNLIDGSKLIYSIENKLDCKGEIKDINDLIDNNDKLILACTHFITLDNSKFKCKIIKNK